MKNTKFAVLTTKDDRCAAALQTVVERVYDRAKKRKTDVVKRFILCPHILGALTCVWRGATSRGDLERSLDLNTHYREF